jgi:hypothetical protein
MPRRTGEHSGEIGTITSSKPAGRRGPQTARGSALASTPFNPGRRSGRARATSVSGHGPCCRPRHRVERYGHRRFDRVNGCGIAPGPRSRRAYTSVSGQYCSTCAGSPSIGVADCLAARRTSHPFMVTCRQLVEESERVFRQSAPTGLLRPPPSASHRFHWRSTLGSASEMGSCAAVTTQHVPLTAP